MKIARKLIGVLLVLVVVMAGLRVVAGLLVGADGFRSMLQGFVDPALARLGLKGSIANGGVRLAGLGTIEITDMTVTGFGDSLPRGGVAEIHLGSFLFSSTVNARGGLTLSDGGHLTFFASIPRAVLARDDTTAGGLSVTGELKGFDVAATLSQLAPAGPAGVLQLKQAKATGRYIYSAVTGPAASLEKLTARFNGSIEGMRFEAQGTLGRSLSPPRLAVDVELNGGKLTLQSPLLFAERIGRVKVGGGLILKPETPPDLDLTVEVEGSFLIQGLLARMLQCKIPPRSPSYRAVGPWGAPDCAAG